MFARNKSTFLAVLSLLALVLVAAPPMLKAQTLRTLKVGFIPITDFLPMYVAMEKGFFAEEGLKLELTPMASGAVIMPAMAGGSLDLGISSAYSLIMAREQGFDFKIVADSAYMAKETALVAHKDANIKNYKQLEGKKVAINALKTVGYVFIKEMVERQGGDINKVYFIEVPFPKMMAPLLNREVDAAHAVEPFATVMAGNPALMVVGNHFNEVNPGGVLAELVATEKWIKANPDQTTKFARAMKRGVDYVNANLVESRGFLPKYTGLSPDLAQRVGLTGYKKNMDVKNLQWTIDFMLKHGVIKKRLNAEDMVQDTAR